VTTQGEYYASGKVHQTKDYARDPAGARQLWNDSAELVGLPT
jgi:hypothetical protein